MCINVPPGKHQTDILYAKLTGLRLKWPEKECGERSDIIHHIVLSESRVPVFYFINLWFWLVNPLSSLTKYFIFLIFTKHG